MNTETPPPLVPTEGIQQCTTSVIILTQDAPRRILLAFHEALGKWVPPGGHQEAGENPIDGGIREVLEETGIDVTEYIPNQKQLNGDTVAIPPPQYLFKERIEANDTAPIHYHLDFVYVVFIPFQEPHPQTNTPHLPRWFTIDETEDIPLFDNVRHIIASLR